MLIRRRNRLPNKLPSKRFIKPAHFLKPSIGVYHFLIVALPTIKMAILVSSHNQSAPNNHYLGDKQKYLDKGVAEQSDVNLSEWPRLSMSTSSQSRLSSSNLTELLSGGKQTSGMSLLTDPIVEIERNQNRRRQHQTPGDARLSGKHSLREANETSGTNEWYSSSVRRTKALKAQQNSPYKSLTHPKQAGLHPENHKISAQVSASSLPPSSQEVGPTNNNTLRSFENIRQQIVPLASSESSPRSSGHLTAPAALVSIRVDVAESKKMQHDPNCALILKRTYILKGDSDSSPTGTDEWGDKFVFNDIDADDIPSGDGPDKKKVKKSDLCIKHSDINKAFEEAKHQIKFKKPDDLDSLDVGERSLASIGELSLATGLLLTKRFDLSHDEILNALPMIDMSASKFHWKDLCPKHVKPMFCMKSRYRLITAHCNNLKHHSWGASKTPYSRYLPPDYADGLSLPRASRNGKPLPSARLITSKIHQDSDEPSHDYSILFASWGQLLNHDVTRVAVGEAPDCCPQYLKGLCMPIPVPADDPLYSKFNVKCLKFDRSLAAIRPKCLLGHRAQINLVTSPVDASFVYGSTQQQAQNLRTFSGGKMKVWNYFEKLKLKPLLPPKKEKPDEECIARPKNLFCFEAGDVRVNEQTHLTVLHTVYVREHNRIAKQLAKINMEWDDEKLYQETRHIVAACVQHVVVNEFLPLLLGHKHIADYHFKPAPGHWPGYDPSVTISTGTAFAAAAFRYGHSMVEGAIRRMDPKSGALVKEELLRFLFKRPFWLYEPGGVDQLIAGMLLTPAEQTDPFVTEELSGHLFQPPKAKFGHDLAAINIQRGRDTGVPGYNDWREWCGLKRAKSFSDLEPLLMKHTAWQYSKIYKHVDDIDLWSAGISERKLPNSAVGPTMACIISRQFLNFKRGDRFWYENPHQPSSFTPGQLREIKKISLAKILCTNADDLPRIQPWAMRLPHPIYNAKVSCDSLPSINLEQWDSSLMENFDSP